MNALDALHIGTLLVVTADAYIVGRVIERTRQHRAALAMLTRFDLDREARP
ncbi:hypothetical protein GCM10027599_26630 [Yimella radicis]